MTGRRFHRATGPGSLKALEPSVSTPSNKVQNKGREGYKRGAELPPFISIVHGFSYGMKQFSIEFQSFCFYSGNFALQTCHPNLFQDVAMLRKTLTRMPYRTDSSSLGAVSQTSYLLETCTEPPTLRGKEATPKE